MSDYKLTQLPEITSIDGTELLYIVDNVDTTPSSKYVTVQDLFNNVPTVTTDKVVTSQLVIDTPYTPASSTETNSSPIGTIWYDAGYIYIKVAQGTIKRAALSTF